MEILPFRPSGVADVIVEVKVFEEIEDIGAAIHPARREGTPLFRKVKQRDVLERNVVEVKVTSKLETFPHELGKVSSKPPSAGDDFGQPSQRSQMAEGRLVRIVNEV